MCSQRALASGGSSSSDSSSSDSSTSDSSSSDSSSSDSSRGAKAWAPPHLPDEVAVVWPLLLLLLRPTALRATLPLVLLLLLLPLVPVDAPEHELLIPAARIGATG